MEVQAPVTPWEGMPNLSVLLKCLRTPLGNWIALVTDVVDSLAGIFVDYELPLSGTILGGGNYRRSNDLCDDLDIGRLLCL